MYLIVGLGNPGREYEGTRHNVGCEAILLWGRSLGVRLSDHRFQSRCALAQFHHEEIALLCPMTFMNLSGRSVKACADFYGLELEKILVLHDDLDLPTGKVKVVRDGGAGGHKGVSSVIEHLGSRQFGRVKMGIGRPRFGETVEDYVLSPFYSDERGIIDQALLVAGRACELVVTEGVGSAMNHINCQNLAHKEERD